jgi:signal transduction histidine kinase
MTRSCTAYVFRTNKPLLLTSKIFNELKEQDEVELVGTPSPSWIGIPLHTPTRVIGVLVLQHYEKENAYSEADVRLLVSIGNQISVSLERKLAEEEIKLKNELLQAVNAEKDKFFSIIAHDLKGPLSAFVSVTQMLTENVKSMSQDEIEDISISMKNDASNIYNLLENLLEWSRLTRGLMEFEPVKFNLNNSINSSTRILSGIASKKGIEIIISVPDSLEVTTDKHMLDTIVRNLVSNAVKFSFSGGIVEVSAYLNQDKSIEIRVMDSGIGMPAQLKNKLFMMNENTGRKGTKGEASSGLGLLLCKEFVEKHDGKIWAESEEGKGSSFYFTVP